MKTADTIEESEARKEQTKPVTSNRPTKYKRGTNPNSHTPRGNGLPGVFTANKWKPGQSGNPSGRPKNDVAHQIARAVFENNQEQLYEQFAKALLKGNAYAFTQLADRAYGKIAEKIEFGPGAEYKDLTTEALVERVKQLECKLGITISSDSSRGTGVNSERTLPPHQPQED